jgi:high-affinity K+ transport system ATPase subunit B
MARMIQLTPEQERRRRQKNIALAIGLVLLVVLFYVITMIKLGGNVA